MNNATDDDQEPTACLKKSLKTIHTLLTNLSLYVPFSFL